MKKQRKHMISIRLNPELIRRIDEYAEEKGIKKIDVVEMALREYLDREAPEESEVKEHA